MYLTAVIPSQSIAPGSVASLPPGQPIQDISSGAQLIQIAAVSSARTNLMSQQLVQTSAGPQLVQFQLPHGTQIVSTPDGPRLLPVAPSSVVSTAFIASTQGSDQPPMQLVAIPPPQPVPPVSLQELQVENSYAPEKHPPTISESGPSSTKTFLHSSKQESLPLLPQHPPSSTASSMGASQWNTLHNPAAPASLPLNPLSHIEDAVTVPQGSAIELNDRPPLLPADRLAAAEWNIRRKLNSYVVHNQVICQEHVFM